jgi:hypothetical protein
VIDTQELERRMRPGAWSHEGFLGPDERLEDVLRADRQTVEELELEPGQLADTLDSLLGARDAAVLELVTESREDMEEAVQKALVAVTAAEQRFGPVEALPAAVRTRRGSRRGRTMRRGPGALVDGRFEVLMMPTAGWQECPWSPTKLFGGGEPCATGSGDWGIRDRQRGIEMRGPELITHLIREHGFFEGFDSPYRVDPRALAELLQLGPFAEPT